MIRPLDRVRSIKVKLGLLVAGSTAAGLLLSIELLRQGLLPRYTFVIGVLLSLVLVQVLARGMTSPLREMAVAARAMARGDYSRRVTATSRDEVGELAAVFNRMAADLGAVDAQRRRLVADVSHELRTPLTALQALLENLADGVAEPDPQTLETAVAQTRRLGRLVQQLLDLSRLEAGEVPLHREQVVLRPFLDDVVREVALQRDTPVTVSVEPASLSVDADPERLHQVVVNLLDNACRHATSRVSVRAVSHESGLRLEVVDDGPGVAPEDRERVFERFTRTDSARAARDGGSGLGLSITRWLVELHGGSVTLTDGAPGCRAVVDLPRNAP
ncbi:MAG: HAMP domain-containing sensor histidine kinase [Mycobacteriales bacterium]|nr:HAMP domain-containing sensor histidine kinase [Mycobacteriales bacterium]